MQENESGCFFLNTVYIADEVLFLVTCCVCSFVCWQDYRKTVAAIVVKLFE